MREQGLGIIKQKIAGEHYSYLAHTEYDFLRQKNASIAILWKPETYGPSKNEQRHSNQALSALRMKKHAGVLVF